MTKKKRDCYHMVLLSVSDTNGEKYNTSGDDRFWVDDFVEGLLVRYKGWQPLLGIHYCVYAWIEIPFFWNSSRGIECYANYMCIH